MNPGVLTSVISKLFTFTADSFHHLYLMGYLLFTVGGRMKKEKT